MAIPSSSPPSLFLHQLRSAGAGVIQELFPRVSCVGTLDVSDNGEHTCAEQLAAFRLTALHTSHRGRLTAETTSCEEVIGRLGLGEVG